MATYQTGTVLDISNFPTHCVSRGYRILKIIVLLSPGHVTIDDHKSFYINGRFCDDYETF